MRKHFYIAMVIMLIFAVGLVAYGAWLNKTGEKTMSSRIESRALRLHGAKAQFREIKPLLTFPTVNLYSDKMTDVVTRVEGVIQASYVERQQQVTVGEALMEIRNEDIPLKILEADSGIARAEAELKRAQNSYERYKRLIEKRATSLEKLEEAEAQYFAAEAAIKQLEAQKAQYQIMNERQTIPAPISGQVLMIYKQPGTFVSAGTPILMIGDFSTLRFKTSMPDEYIRALLPLEAVKEVDFPMSDFPKVYGTEYGAGNEGKSQVFSAKIVSVTPDLNVKAEMRTILFEIDNSSGILEPQTYSTMDLKSMNPRRALTVPVAAMINQDNSEVFIVNANQKLEKRKVKTGSNDGTFIEVLSGLNEGEIVIVSSANGLIEGMAAEVEFNEQ